MSIAQTLRQIADWDNRPLIQPRDWELAMDFFDDLYPDFNGVDDNRMLLLMAAEVAGDEGAVQRSELCCEVCRRNYVPLFRTVPKGQIGPWRCKRCKTQVPMQKFVSIVSKIG